MANVVVVGSQWGDEGKGKIVDWLSEQADIVVRFRAAIMRDIRLLSAGHLQTITAAFGSGATWEALGDWQRRGN
jgi:hypothetical protein